MWENEYGNKYKMNERYNKFNNKSVSTIVITDNVSMEECKILLKYKIKRDVENLNIKYRKIKKHVDNINYREIKYESNIEK
jgi:hypothetical protein